MIRRVLGIMTVLTCGVFFAPVLNAHACTVLESCPSSAPANKSSGSSQQVDTVSMEQQFFDLINRERTSRGMSPLSYSSRLTGYARSHSDDMNSQGRLYHNQSELESAQFNNDMGHPSMVGENVGEGPTVQWLHDAFMNSEEHRSNILESRYTAIGVGVSYSNKDSTIWVTEDFIRAAGSRGAHTSFPARPVIQQPVLTQPIPHVTVKPFRFASTPSEVALGAAALVVEVARMHRPPAISVLRLPPIPAIGSDGGVPLHKAKPLLPLAVLATLSAVAFASRRDAGAYI